jgi:F-box-like
MKRGLDMSESSAINLWSFLPEEILTKIFSFQLSTTILHNLRHVCKLWHKLVHKVGFLESRDFFLAYKCTTSVSGFLPDVKEISTQEIYSDVELKTKVMGGDPNSDPEDIYISVEDEYNDLEREYVTLSGGGSWAKIRASRYIQHFKKMKGCFRVIPLLISDPTWCSRNKNDYCYYPLAREDSPEKLEEHFHRIQKYYNPEMAKYLSENRGYKQCIVPVFFLKVDSVSPETGENDEDPCEIKSMGFGYLKQVFSPPSNPSIILSLPLDVLNILFRTFNLTILHHMRFVCKFTHKMAHSQAIQTKRDFFPGYILRINTDILGGNPIKRSTKVYHLTWEELTFPDDTVKLASKFSILSEIALKSIFMVVPDYNKDQWKYNSENHLTFTEMAYETNLSATEWGNIFTKLAKEFLNRDKVPLILVPLYDWNWDTPFYGDDIIGIQDYVQPTSTMVDYLKDDIQIFVNAIGKKIHVSDRKDTESVLDVPIDSLVFNDILKIASSSAFQYPKTTQIPTVSVRVGVCIIVQKCFNSGNIVQIQNLDQKINDDDESIADDDDTDRSVPKIINRKKVFICFKVLD